MSALLPPESGSKSITNDDALREREFALKEREIALKEQEVKAKIELEKRGVWFSSPLLIGITSAIFGLIGTGIGAILQGFSNFQLERQKFEFSLIQKALETQDRNEAARRLIFLVDTGIIQSLNGARIRGLAARPNQLPTISCSRPPSSEVISGLQLTIEKVEKIDGILRIYMKAQNQTKQDKRLSFFFNEFYVNDNLGGQYGNGAPFVKTTWGEIVPALGITRGYTTLDRPIDPNASTIAVNFGNTGQGPGDKGGGKLCISGISIR